MAPFSFQLWVVSLPPQYSADHELLKTVTLEEWCTLVRGSDYINETTKRLRVNWLNDALNAAKRNYDLIHAKLFSSGALSDSTPSSIREWILTNADVLVSILEKYKTQRDISIYMMRAYYDALYFVLRTTSEVAEPPDNHIISLKKAEYDELVRQDSTEKQKEADPVLSKEAILSRVRAKYAFGSVQSCIMKLYLEIPLRDDAQLRMVLLHAKGPHETLPGDAIKVIESVFQKEEQRANAILYSSSPVEEMWIYIAVSKTIPSVHPPLLHKLSHELTTEILAYVYDTGITNQWRWPHKIFSAGLLFAGKGASATGKLSLTIRQIMRKSLNIADGGINYLRRVHQSEATTAEEIAVVNQQAGHSSVAGELYRREIT